MIDKMDGEAVITEEEAALYDRQIRLWGLDSQKRLRQARILIFGISGLGVEVAKNVILAGVKSLTLMDSACVTLDDAKTNFTLTEADVEKNRAVTALPNIQKLNPMVNTTAITGNLEEKNEDFFNDFDVVCTIGCSRETTIRINHICSEKNIHFISGDAFGFYGYAFFDLGNHEYSEDVPNKVKKTEDNIDGSGEPAAKKQKIDDEAEATDGNTHITVKKTMNFIRLQNALQGKDESKKSPALFDLLKVIWRFRDENGCLPTTSMDEKLKQSLSEMLKNVDEKLANKPNLDLASVLSQTSGEFSPVCVIVGGVIGQEVIKAVSQKDVPLNNFFLFDGVDGAGYVQLIGSES